MMTEWAALSERMAEMLAALGDSAANVGPLAGDAEPKPREKNYTPLEGDALKDAVEFFSYRPEIRRGKLYFSCPACQHPTSVFKFYTATATRCPKCYSAIRTPDLKRSCKAFNLERDIDAYLHPDRFEALLPRRRTIATVVPLPKFNTAFAACGTALVLGLSMLSIRMVGARGSSDAIPTLAKYETAQDTRDLSGRAVDTVKAYLEAKGAVRKSAFVKDGARVARLMSRAFKASPELEPMGYRQVSCEGSGVSPVEGTDHFVSKVSALMESGRVETFVVEHLPHADLIEWEASTGYNPHGWDSIAARATDTRGEEVAQMRVLAYPDNYYNYRFDDERQHLCLRLENPSDNNLLGYGYASWDEAQRLGLLDAVGGAPPPQRLTLELAFDAATAKTRQVEIVGLPQHGWRAPAGTMLATSGPGEPE